MDRSPSRTNCRYRRGLIRDGNDPPGGSSLYFTFTGPAIYTDTVSVINTTTNTVIATIPVGVGPELVAITPDGTRAYVPNIKSDTVSVINTATNTVIATVPVGIFPSERRLQPTVVALM